MKKAVALFYTLIFLIAVMFLIHTILKTYQNISSTNTPKIIAQNNVILKDLDKDLKNILKDINTSDALKNIFNTFFLSSKNGEFRVKFKISPYSNRINLNLYSAKKYRRSIDEFLNKILDEYQIDDPIFFKDLILDTLDIDLKEREADSEIALKDRDFLQGRIYNFSHLKKILNYYAKKRYDKKIFNIPWKKIIYFSQKEYIIPCEFINKELANILDLDFETMNCKEMNKDEEYKKIFKRYNIKLFNKKDNLLIKINLNYILDNIEENLSIVYDIKTNKKVLIESNPIY